MTEAPRKLKRILAASDLSDQAGMAIERAVELGVEHAAEVVIVHVVDEGLPKEAQSLKLTTSDHYIRGKLADLPHAKQVDVTIDIVVGRPELDILERAEIEDVDCIVVGLHNRLLDENLAIEGTLAEQIICATHKPVLIVKNKPRGRYNSVVVGVDFSAFSRTAIRAAAMLVPQANLHLVNAYEAVETGTLLTRLSDESSRMKHAAAYRARIANFVHEEMQWLAEHGVATGLDELRIHPVAVNGSPHDVLQSEAKRLKADLIVLGTHGKIGLARAILGSVSTQIINDRCADVLVVRPY